MSISFEAALERLSRVPGVRGALIVDGEAGLPVVAELSAEVDGAPLAALAASVFRRTSRAADSAGFGQLSTLQLEAEGGHVVMAGAGELMVVAVADRAAQIGLVRLEVYRAAEGLR